jgi:DNA primase
MGFYSDLCLFTFIVSTVYGNLKPASTKDWLIEFHNHVEPDVAKRIAKRYAMVSRGPVGVFREIYFVRFRIIKGVK